MKNHLYVNNPGPKEKIWSGSCELCTIFSTVLASSTSRIKLHLIMVRQNVTSKVIVVLLFIKCYIKMLLWSNFFSLLNFCTQQTFVAEVTSAMNFCSFCVTSKLFIVHVVLLTGRVWLMCLTLYSCTCNSI